MLLIDEVPEGLHGAGRRCRCQCAPVTRTDNDEEIRPAMQAFWNFINQHVRFILAGVCFLLAVRAGAHPVSPDATGTAARDWRNPAVGRLGSHQCAHPYGRTIPKVNFAINTGLLLIVLSWFMRSV